MSRSTEKKEHTILEGIEEMTTEVGLKDCRRTFQTDENIVKAWDKRIYWSKWEKLAGV